jgi:hypothetical protein
VLFQDAIACQMPVLLFDTWRIRVGELIRAKVSVNLILLVNSVRLPRSAREPSERFAATNPNRQTQAMPFGLNKVSRL